MKVSMLSVLAFASSVLGQAQVFLHPERSRNKCIDVAGGVLANGTAVQMWDCNRTPAQVWEINLGKTTIRSANSTFCLDTGPNPVNGTEVKIWQCIKDRPTQQWYVTLGWDARIALYNHGLCLDLTNGNLTNGNVLQVWQCTNDTICKKENARLRLEEGMNHDVSEYPMCEETGSATATTEDTP